MPSSDRDSTPQDSSRPPAGPALLSSLLDLLGVTAPAQRSQFKRLMAAQARRRIPAAQAESVLSEAFSYHAALAEQAVGIVHALHGGQAAPSGSSARYDETALRLGLSNVGGWTDLRTCSPLRYAARLMLTPEQHALLMWIIRGDEADAS